MTDTDVSEITDSRIYEAIGMAVVAAQMFENIFIIACRLAIKQADATTVEDVVPVQADKALKQPVKALLKELSGVQPIAALEDRVLALIERRHIVVHRLQEATGWPGNVTDQQRIDIRELCIEVSAEGLDLHTTFLQLLGEWGKRFPNMQEGIEAAKLHEMYRRDQGLPNSKA
ncbi:hypothetical protein ASC74_18510 [Pseudomonas sp. Root329]|uniref:hypothetical protein n=1 Tax=Pseudomonas sp. Root329 TaxID=1736515 RepID=UPI0006F632E3|nr:hypothetical protein [Pseudomonas sp. Root329]KQV21049.1 hypothetical protein ASC74_18510 [Pseudomonas sp. Root329]